MIENKSKSKKILVLGTTFKKDTSGITNSQSLKLIKILLEKGYDIGIYDVPKDKIELPKDLKVNRIENFEQAVKEYNDIVIASDWSEFAELENIKFERRKNIFDLKHICRQENPMCDYYFIGKSKESCH